MRRRIAGGSRREESGTGSLLRDPKEDDPITRTIIETAFAKAAAELENAGVERNLGYCHQLWDVTQRILRDEYAIQWRTPSEMNPDVLFD